MKKIYLLLLLQHTLVFTQNNPTSVNQIIIRDTSGSVQTRNINTPFWSPILPSMSIPERSFIRLNSLESIVTLTFPDGSLLKLIGIGSIFLDEISKANFNKYNNKILLISGRWVYQSNPLHSSRLILNTDITTSVIENGTGGGYFYNGTNEFVLQKGRGFISYRQSTAKAFVLDETQYVNFNIYDGFFYPKLATDEILNQYFFFENTIQTNQNNSNTNSSMTDLASSILSYNDNHSLHYVPLTFKSQDISQQNIFSSYQNLSKNELQQIDINLNYLDNLTDLKFPTKQHTENNTVVKQIEEKIKTNRSIQQKRSISKNINKNLNPNLLKSINISDFSIKQISTNTTKKTNNTTTTNKISNSTKRQRNVTKPVKKTIKPKKIKTTKDTKDKKNIDINELVQSLGEQITQEQIQKKELEQEKSIENKESINNNAINIIKSVKIPDVTTTQEDTQDDNIENSELDEINTNTMSEEERLRGHDAPDDYYRRNTESDEYRMRNQFNPKNEKDFLNSDFNSVLFTL